MTANTTPKGRAALAAEIKALIAEEFGITGGTLHAKINALASLPSVAPVEARQPLRGEQLLAIYREVSPVEFCGMVRIPENVVAFARAVERAHDIGALAPKEKAVTEIESLKRALAMIEENLSRPGLATGTQRVLLDLHARKEAALAVHLAAAKSRSTA